MNNPHHNNLPHATQDPSGGKISASTAFPNEPFTIDKLVNQFYKLGSGPGMSKTVATIESSKSAPSSAASHPPPVHSSAFATKLQNSTALAQHGVNLSAQPPLGLGVPPPNFHNPPAPPVQVYPQGHPHAPNFQPPHPQNGPPPGVPHPQNQYQTQRHDPFYEQSGYGDGNSDPESPGGYNNRAPPANHVRVDLSNVTQHPIDRVVLHIHQLIDTAVRQGTLLPHQKQGRHLNSVATICGQANINSHSDVSRLVIMLVLQPHSLSFDQWATTVSAWDWKAKTPTSVFDPNGLHAVSLSEYRIAAQAFQRKKMEIEMNTVLPPLAKALDIVECEIGLLESTLKICETHRGTLTQIQMNIGRDAGEHEHKLSAFNGKVTVQWDHAIGLAQKTIQLRHALLKQIRFDVTNSRFYNDANELKVLESTSAKWYTDYLKAEHQCGLAVLGMETQDFS